jgi:YHS domain-containing protein
MATGAKEKAQDAQAPTTRPALPLCPVMGGPVDFSVRTMTDDGPVYFCCPDCIPDFEKTPAKYADMVAAQRQVLKKMERVQVACPVTGNPIDGKTFIMSEGQGVNFCCKNCPAKYEQDPAKYKAKLEASYTYQTRCPVSGEKIDPAAYVDLTTGQRIYLCCKGCGEQLTKDPAKYTASLAEQGIKLDLKKLKAQPDKKDEPGGHDHP